MTLPHTPRPLDRVPGTVLAICATVVAVTIVAAFVALAIAGADATELRQLINTVLNASGLVVGITGAVAAGVAAKSAQTAVKQTNSDLDQRIANGVAAALIAHEEGRH